MKVIMKIVAFMCCLAIGIALVSCSGTKPVNELLEVPVSTIQTMGNTVEQGGYSDSFLPTLENTETDLSGENDDDEIFETVLSGENDDDIITIMSKDINETLEITIPARATEKSAFFDSYDIEKIVIPKSDDDGYYEVEFWLMPDAIKKAEPAVSYMSDFPIYISVNRESFEFYLREDGAECHYSRSFSSISEGLRELLGFDCPMYESKISREEIKELFSK